MIKNHKAIIFFFIIVASFIRIEPSKGFSHSIAAETSGEPYPHILKKQTFNLNTRNIKVLTSKGKHLWVGTEKGLIRHNTQSREDYEIFDNQNHLLSNGIFAVSIDPKNQTWIGTYGGGLSRFDGKNWQYFNTPQGLNDAFVYDIKFKNDAIWIATWSGINMIIGDPSKRSNWKTYNVENTHGGLIDNWVYAIEIESSSKIWFGTESGISSYKNGKWQSFNQGNGLGAPYKKVRDQNQSIISSFKGKHHAATPSIPNIQNSNYRPNYIISMLLDEKNRLWAGTWGGGLSMLDTKTLKFRNFTVDDGLPGNFILSLEKDSFGGLWIGTNNGLSRFNGKTFQNFSTINGLKTKFIFSIEVSLDHSLWVGGNNSLTRLILNPETGIPIHMN